MRVNKVAYKYLQEAVKLAEKDLAKIISEQERYLQPASVESAREILKMLEDGFDLIKSIEQRVKIEIALGDLNGILYFANPEGNKK